MVITITVITTCFFTTPLSMQPFTGIPLCSNLRFEISISLAVFNSNLATSNTVPTYWPIIAASVTANIGGVSTKIKSYSLETDSKNNFNLSCISSSEGFGGTCPLVMRSRLSNCVFKIALPTVDFLTRFLICHCCYLPRILYEYDLFSYQHQ